jgi:hypothetical protein
MKLVYYGFRCVEVALEAVFQKKILVVSCWNSEVKVSWFILISDENVIPYGLDIGYPDM